MGSFGKKRISQSGRDRAGGRSPPFCGQRAPRPLVLRPVMQYGWIEIGAILPDQRFELGIETHGPEDFGLAKRAIKLAPKNRFKIDDAFQAVFESDTEPVTFHGFKTNDMMQRMCHAGRLTQRFNRHNPSAGLETRPVLNQFGLVQLRPRLDQPARIARSLSAKTASPFQDTT